MVLDEVWRRALQRLGSAHPAALPALLSAVTRLRAAGGVPFEIILGTPVDRYGARLTVRARTEQDISALAELAGLAGHPWGLPDWIGVRTAADGTVHYKAYHRRPPSLGFTTVHRGLPDTAEPVMAALDGPNLEIYAVEPGQLSWQAFRARCLAALDLDPDLGLAELSLVALAGRPRGFGVSVRQVAGEIEALSLFAFPATLPVSDDQVTAGWTASMSQPDRAGFEASVVAVDSLGASYRRRYGLLGWSFDRTGLVSRAASLHAPPG